MVVTYLHTCIIQWKMRGGSLDRGAGKGSCLSKAATPGATLILL